MQIIFIPDIIWTFLTGVLAGIIQTKAFACVQSVVVCHRPSLSPVFKIGGYQKLSFLCKIGGVTKRFHFCL